MREKEDYTDFKLFVATQIYIGFLIGMLADGSTSTTNTIAIIGTMIYLSSIFIILLDSVVGNYRRKE